MNEFEDIQRLIRLKRFEQPEEGFTESFLNQFHQRQRAEMLKQSSLQLFFERVSTWWEHLLVPKWSMAAAAFSACALGLWQFSRPVDKATESLTAVPAVPAVPEKPFVPKMDLSDLPLARMAEQEDAAKSAALLRKQLEARPVLEGNTTAPSSLPASGWQQPTLQNATPAVQSGREGMLGK